MKEGVKKMTGPLEVRHARFLFRYRVTPQATTGISPAELLMGRRLRTHLDLLHSTLKERVQRCQTAQESRTQKHSMRQFKPEDQVVARNFAEGTKWLPGSGTECDSVTSVKIRLDDGRVWRRHVAHVVYSQVPVAEMEEVSQSEPSAVPVQPSNQLAPDASDRHSEQEAMPRPDSSNPSDSERVNPAAIPDEADPPHDCGTTLRRSTRTHQPPDRYQ